MNIIFDLDLTLVDSSISEAYRSSRNWNKVYELIPKFELYEGFDDVFKYIIENNIQVIIITNSPGMYAKKVIDHFNIPCHLLLDYFSCNRLIKPKPNQFFKAFEISKKSSCEFISIGDKIIDYQASKLANVSFLGALWDKNSEFINTKDIACINRPIDLIDYLNNYYG